MFRNYSEVLSVLTFFDRNIILLDQAKTVDIEGQCTPLKHRHLDTAETRLNSRKVCIRL